jgi:hypothetical protein
MFTPSIAMEQAMTSANFRIGFEYGVFHAWDYPKYLKEGFYGPFVTEEDAEIDARASEALRTQ